MGEICDTGHFVFPPRDVCPHCGDNASKTYEFNGHGEVYSYTVIYEAPAGFEEFVPYVEALIKLNEGPMLTAQLTDLPTKTETVIIDGEKRKVMRFVVEIGDKVEMVTRIKSRGGENGIIDYGYKFRPAVSSSKFSR